MRVRRVAPLEGGDSTAIPPTQASDKLKPVRNVGKIQSKKKVNQAYGSQIQAAEGLSLRPGSGRPGSARVKIFRTSQDVKAYPQVNIVPKDEHNTPTPNSEPALVPDVTSRSRHLSIDSGSDADGEVEELDKQDLSLQNKSASVTKRPGNINTQRNGGLQKQGSLVTVMHELEARKNLMHTKGADPHIAVAYCYIQDALNGRLASGKGAMYFKETYIQRFFLINNSFFWKYLVITSSIIHCLLTIAEPSNPLAPSPAPVLAAEAFIIIIYVLDIVFKATYTGRKKYIKNWQHRVQVMLTIFFLLDWILAATARTPRFARILRPGILVVRSRDLRKTAYTVRRMIPELSGVFFGLAGYILLFALMAVYLFQRESRNYISPNGTREFSIPGSFDNILISSLRTFVLFSTENYPEVILPAWDHSRWSFVFFFVFIYIGVFFLRSFLLATIVHIYFNRAGQQVTKERKKEWKGLIKAFSLLDVDCKGYITFDTWDILLRVMRPKSTMPERRFLFNLLDRTHCGRLDYLDFLDFREITQLHVTPLAPEKSRSISRSAFTKKSLQVTNLFVRSKWHPRLDIALILANSVLACIVWNDMPNSYRQPLLIANVLLVLVMLVLYAMIFVGREYGEVKSTRILRADAVTLFLAFLFYLISFADPVELVACTLVGHILIFLRLTWSFKYGRLSYMILGRILPPMFQMTLFVLVWIYMFAVLGMYFFWGKEPKIKTDAYYFQYGCNLGFDSFGCAMFALFQQLTGNNWNDAMNSLMATVGDHAALYFVFFFVLVNLLLMDLMVAITIEAFMSAIKTIGKAEANTSISTVVVRNPYTKAWEKRSSSSLDKQRILGSSASLGALVNNKRGSLYPNKASKQTSLPNISDSEISNSETEAENDKIQGGEASADAEPSAGPLMNRLESNTSTRMLQKLNELSDQGSDVNTEKGDQERGRSRWNLMRKGIKFAGLWMQVARDKGERQSHEPHAFKVVRVPGAWRRELIQGQNDAVSSMKDEDVKALAKNARLDLTEMHRRKVIQRSNSRSTASSISPILRRYSSTIRRSSVDSTSPRRQSATYENFEPSTKASTHEYDSAGSRRSSTLSISPETAKESRNSFVLDQKKDRLLMQRLPTTELPVLTDDSFTDSQPSLDTGDESERI
eukprot:m.109064 g.109064  ORF g.109064 m.109064 type:complete len:1147 (-) comp13990_c0_seq1:70-3510(-)